VLPDLATNKAFLATFGADLGRIRLFDHPGFNSVMSDTGLRAGRGMTEGPRRAPAEHAVRRWPGRGNPQRTGERVAGGSEGDAEATRAAFNVKIGGRLGQEQVSPRGSSPYPARRGGAK
jgi:hypothetical protein